MDYKETSQSIKQWAEDDRPREKLIQKGKNQMSDAELLAIIIGSGTKKDSALDLAKRILIQVNHQLFNLQKWSVGDLVKIKGIGPARAVSILSALELGRRINFSDRILPEKISSSRDAFEILKNQIGALPHEEFWVLFLSNAHKVILKKCISSGGFTGTVVDIRMILKQALEVRATAIILSHNHPSGNLQPSQPDINLTKKIKEAGLVMDIKVLDHLILSDTDYFSFADEGMI